LHSWFAGTEDAVTSRDCFRLAERIEVLARDIYTELAYHPGTPPGVGQVLLRLADEEEHHAQRIRLLKATHRNSDWAEKALIAIATDLQAIAAELGGLLVLARHRRDPDDFAGMFDRLVDMEDRFAFVHAEELTTSAEPEVARLFEALARQDVWHRQLLERARRGAPQLAAQGA
jgi:rubrerythrin